MAPGRDGRRSEGKVVRGVRITSALTQILVVESLTIGIAALPAVAFWNWVGALHPWDPWILRTMILSISLVPAYLLFSMALMALTAFFCRILRWYTPLGAHSVEALSPEVLRWVKYSVACHIVRILCGELFRATPVWTWYVRAMGAAVGRGVHINSRAVYDLNLITMEDRVVVGGRAQISCHFVEKGLLKVAPVVLREGATLGTGSIISPGVEVGPGGQVGALSFVTKHTKVPAHTAYGGVPARFLKSYESKGGVEEEVAEEVIYRSPSPSAAGSEQDTEPEGEAGPRESEGERTPL